MKIQQVWNSVCYMHRYGLMDEATARLTMYSYVDKGLAYVKANGFEAELDRGNINEHEPGNEDEPF